MSTEVITEIKRLKNEKNALLLVHNYQEPTIQQLGDFVGDSLELARKASQIDCEIIVFAGANFMAETAAVLNPDKTVLIPSPSAKCPMAHMLSAKQVDQYKNKYPEAAIAVYVNTTAEVKAKADICITSGNAAQIVAKLKEKQVLVGPDRNLAFFIQKMVPEKEIIPFPEIGHCYVHQKFHEEDILNLKKSFPNAEILIHPEVRPEVQALADRILSTSGMIKAVGESNSKEFIIATEIGLIDRLKLEFPKKKFISARTDAICVQQKKITVYNLYLSLLHLQYKITIPKEIREKSRMSIEKMLDLSI